MKKFSKQTSIILSAILGIVLVIGLIFSFVPMKFGDTTWVGLSNSINISSDIVGGMYGEFEIKTVDDELPTRAEIEQSKGIIRDVLSERGYKNANVYDIAGEKIRVELSYPKGSTTYQDVVTSLQLMVSGKFQLQSASSVADDTVVVEGFSCVDNVELKTSESGIMSAKINFNANGRAKYEELCNKVSKTDSSSSSSGTNQIYVALGSETPQSIDISNAISMGVYDYLELQSESYEGIVDLIQRIQIGCMAVEFKENTMSIDTMSARLTAGEAASSPEFASFFSSSTFVILIAAIVFVAAALIAIFAIKFGYYAILIFITMLINAVLFLSIVCLIPSIEFGYSAFAAMAISMALIYTFALDFAFSVKKEYNNGKSLNAALETAYKNKFVIWIVSNSTLFLSALAFIMLSFGELTSVGVIFAISVFLSLMTNLFIIPFLIKIGLSFGNFGRKLFMLKKRSLDELSLSTEANEKEAD